MIDANKTIDLVKLKFYNEYLYTNHITEEGDSPLHKTITEQVVRTYIDPLKLPFDSKILDMGCGPGYFLDLMKERGYTDLTGVTLSPEDIKTCEEKGHTIKQYDLSFLPQAEGYYDESVDFIFLRHALEHSPYPIFTLMEYNRVLKQNGLIYIEVPAPDCDRKYEYYPNHYSIMGHNQLAALLVRTGFDIKDFKKLDFTVQHKDNGETEQAKENYYMIVAEKKRPLDVK